MYVKRLEYENFRNLKNGAVEPGNGINVIYGDNAEGKTNLIEAIWLFTGQRSFRGAKDSQLVTLGSDAPSRIRMSFNAAGRNQKAEITVTTKRCAQINNIPLDSPYYLSESFCAVIFSPTDMDLIKEGPALRRKFLDNAISVLHPKYEKLLGVYNRAVAQRNAILRDVMFHNELEYMLDMFEDRIAKSGEYLISQRKKYIGTLKKWAPDIYTGISNMKESFDFEYKCSCGDGSYHDIMEYLKYNRGEDTKTCATGVGAHRDDVEFLIGGVSAKVYASQGQKRSAILSLKLAEAEILKQFSGEQPVAVLDDVMSELDPTRQDYILNHIKGWQVFITCCDPNTVKNLAEGRLFHVKNGEVTAE